MNYQCSRVVRLFLTCLIFSFCCNFFAQEQLDEQLFEQQYEHPSIEPLFLPEDVLAVTEEQDSALSVDEVFRLALLFSECSLESEEGQACLSTFEKIKTEVSGESFMQLELEDRGRAVLKLLYRDYLTTYSFNQTRIDEALQTGVYNCVSSALLYLVAAKAAGLEVRGQKTSEHAFCTVYIPNGSGGKSNQYKKIDVETTNPYGFNPGSKETIENEDKIQGYYTVPKKYYSNRQEVSDAVFAGLIAGNICAAYIEQNDYEKAIPLGAARYEFVKTEQSKPATQVRRDFDILASNYVNIEVENSQIFSGYIDWFISFIDRWGMTDYLQKNMDNSFNNLMVYCFEEKNYETAVESYEKSKPYLTQNQINKTPDILTDILVSSKIDGQPAEAQIEAIETIFTEGLLEPEQEKRALVYLENAWLSILNDCMTGRIYGTGYQKSCDALERLPDSTKIKKMQKSFYDNCIAIIHNNFAEQANARRFTEARKVLEAGMLVFPDDKTLNADLATLNRMTN